MAMHLHAARPWALRRGTYRLVLPRPFTSYELRLGTVEGALSEKDDTLAARLTEALNRLRTPAMAPVTAEA